MYVFLAYLEVLHLLHVIQGSQEDVPDSLEEGIDIFLQEMT
jgi:hypothetical protein